MISKISVKDYRSCLNTTFELHPNLSVLIGPNSAGKTNILNALLLLKRLVDEKPYFYHGEEKPTGQCKLKVWFDVGGKKIILNAAVDIFTDDSNNDVVVSSNQYWTAKDFTGNQKQIRFPLWMVREFAWAEGHEGVVRFNLRQHYIPRRRFQFNVPDKVIKPLSAIVNTLGEMRYYSASQFTNPGDCPVSFEIEKEGNRSRGIRLSRHAKFLFDLYTSWKSTEPGAYSQFFEIVGPKGIGLINNILFKEIPTSSIDYSVRSGGQVIQRKREKILIVPQFRIENNELSPNQLSEGTFKTITLLFYLVTEVSRLLLIEEPEVCVHHGLLSSIIELIKTYSVDKQIVVSTHSDFVLDEVDPENVYRVTKSPDTGTSVAHITKAMSRRELSALHHYLETEGNLGEYWRHGGLE
ncbi:MAG: AAA family ATPase [Candidatus Marinimicrobia bacterium]|nr:AAA family ATPase [Candidatus Neomarinimicrobiota bacterium]